MLVAVLNLCGDEDELDDAGSFPVFIIIIIIIIITPGIFTTGSIKK